MEGVGWKRSCWVLGPEAGHTIVIYAAQVPQHCFGISVATLQPCMCVNMISMSGHLAWHPGHRGCNKNPLHMAGQYKQLSFRQMHHSLPCRALWWLLLV